MTLTVEEAREELKELSQELDRGLRRVRRGSDLGEVEFHFTESGCGFALTPPPQPASKWIKASRHYPLFLEGRSASASFTVAEREFGRLKNEYGLTHASHRGIERVALHAELTMLARLSVALARARPIPLAA